MENWRAEWARIRSRNQDLRLGQWFCNKYKLNNPELFYEVDDRKAVLLIEEIESKGTKDETKVS